MNSVDRVLDVIDAGLQTPVPDPTFGEVSPTNVSGCVRCAVGEVAEGSDFCGGCRAFLLGDSEMDPARTGVAFFGEPSAEYWPIEETDDTVLDERAVWVLITDELLADAGVRVTRARAGSLDPGRWLSSPPFETPSIATGAVTSPIAAACAAHRCDGGSGVPLGFLGCEPVDPVAVRREQARARERELLAERRRGHRRTNRW